MDDEPESGHLIQSGLRETLRGLHRDESGHKSSFVGDAKFLAGFNPGEVSRCVLS